MNFIVDESSEKKLSKELVEILKKMKLSHKFDDGIEVELSQMAVFPVTFSPKEVEYCSKSCLHFVDLADGKWASGGLCHIWNKVLKESKVQGIYLCCDECIKYKSRQ